MYLNYNLRKILASLIGIAFLSFLNSCSDGKFWNPADARTVPQKVDDRVRKNLEEGRGITLGGLMEGQSGTSYQFASSNPMWRATLDILDFLPFANVDYSGGIITTDWYNEGTATDESIKITIRFLSNEIRADGIKVIVHKQKCNIKQKCTVKKISSALEYELQVAILKKAAIFAKEDIGRNRKKSPKLRDKKK